MDFCEGLGARANSLLAIGKVLPLTTLSPGDLHCEANLARKDACHLTKYGYLTERNTENIFQRLNEPGSQATSSARNSGNNFRHHHSEFQIGEEIHKRAYQFFRKVVEHTATYQLLIFHHWLRYLRPILHYQ